MPESLPPAALALVATAERLAEEVLLPLESRLTRGEIDESAALAAARDGSRAAGLFTLTLPRKFGGNPPGILAMTALRDTLAAYNCRLTRGIFAPAPGPLADCGEPLRSRYLMPLLAGELRSAFAFTESESAERHTSARRRQDPTAGEQLVIDGRKSYVTGGADADFILTLVEFEGPERALVVVDRHLPGVHVEHRFESLDGSHHAVIRFDGAVVPATHVIGAPGEGMARARGQIGDTRLAMAAHAVGLCRWTLKFLTRHLNAPHRFGEPLAQREGVRLRYADLRIKAFAARSVLYRTARLAEAGNEIRNEGMACKIIATETIGELVDTGIQLVGGNALIAGHPLERLFRVVRSMRIAEGANDVLRINLARGALEFDQGAI
jgi:acyl-CoA dehydrogenase